MLVAHITDTLETGGAEVLLASLCRLHRQAGHSAAVHCLFRAGPIAPSLAEEGFPIHVHGPLPGWRLSLGLYRHFRNTPPDVVHCHNGTATTLAAPAARLAGVSVIVTTRHGLAAADHSRWGEFKFRLAARCCDRVVAVCETACANLAARAGPSAAKILTIRNGAEPAPLGPEAPDPIRKDGFNLIHVARLMWKKDQATLLRATALALRQISDLRLWIVGDGPDRPMLESLAGELGISGRVCFLGERSDVGRWLSRADLFVLSSRTEGTPLALLEAMAAGLPFVVTDAGGLPEVAQLSGAGTVAPSGDAAALAQAILDHAGRRHELPALGARARQCYQQHFAAERMADDYLRLYEECLRERKRSFAAISSRPGYKEAS
jgi:glycosyltransferase involved in cell wall biosynthesis